MIDIIGLFDTLLTASFRGVGFSIIDTRLEVGRRMQRELFPGLDTSNFQDLGAMDGPIRISGLISGDNYVYAAEQLRQAFRTPGPGTLVHPWIPDTQVVLQGTATISFKDSELRLVRFEATFIPFLPADPVEPDTLQALLAQLDDLETQAEAWMASVLAPLILPLAVFSYGVSFVSTMTGYWTVLTQGGVGLDILGPAAAPAIAALAANPQSYGSSWAASTVSALAAVPASITAASVPTPVAAVGPGGAATTPEAADPRDAVTLLLAANTKLSGLTSMSPVPSLAIAMQAMIMNQTLSAASDIVYTSQQDAIALRNTLLAALDGVIISAANAAGLDPAAAASTWRSLVAARSAFLVDINSEIGRLPAVVTILLPTTMPAWLVAQYLAGDTPSAVRAQYLDIVARNQVTHPAMVPAGDIEALA